MTCQVPGCEKLAERKLLVEFVDEGELKRYWLWRCFDHVPGSVRITEHDLVVLDVLTEMARGQEMNEWPCTYPWCKKPAVWNITVTFIDNNKAERRFVMQRCLDHAGIGIDVKDIVSTENVVSGTER